MTEYKEGIHKMKIIKEPTEEDAGVGIHQKRVYHFFKGSWMRCGDCKITDKHIKILTKIRIRKEDNSKW